MRKAPGIIRIFSYFFMFMGIVASCALILGWLKPSQAPHLSVTFITNSYEFSKSPILYTATSLFFVFAGILGFLITQKKSYAYDVGIAYCITGLLFFNSLILSQNGLIQNQIFGILIQSVIFGSFMIYLIRNHKEWKNGG